MPELDISPAKVGEIIILAREIDRAEGEFDAVIESLNEDEQANLVAIMWIGRGSFEPEDWDEAVNTAMNEATIPTADYLMGMPHLPENIEAGLEALGVDVSGEEEDLL